jgi:hypothetical protein
VFDVVSVNGVRSFPVTIKMVSVMFVAFLNIFQFLHYICAVINVIVKVVDFFYLLLFDLETNVVPNNYLITKVFKHV